MMPFPFLQFDENIKLIIRRYDQANSELEKSLLSEGRSLKPETPEPDGDSNQERAKDRGKVSDNVVWQTLLLDEYPYIKPPTIYPVMVIQPNRERRPTPSWLHLQAAAVRRWRQSYKRGLSLVKSRPVMLWRSTSV